MKILKRCCTNVLYYTFYYQNLFAYLCQRCQLKFLEQAISVFVVMNVAVELSNTCILLQYIKRFRNGLCVFTESCECNSRLLHEHMISVCVLPIWSSN